MAINLQPMADRLVVKPIEKEEKTKGGIILPDTAKEKPQEGEVLAVGPGKMSDDGTRIAMDVKVGDKVKSGDNVVVLEAMKMAIDLPSTVDGVVKAINFKAGDNVARDDILAVIG